MRNFIMALAYDGTDFAGWQRLGKARTVQGAIERALSRVLGADTEISGSGRTDAGVHALCQVANFHAPTSMPAESLARKLAAQLPEDVALLSLEDAGPRFHARLNALRKRYRYRIRNVGDPSPFDRLYAHHVPEALDVARMEEAAGAFLGEHNFQTFTNLKEKDKSFVRRIDSIACRRHGEYIDVLLEGSGFLHNQARIMAAALIEAGAGRLDRPGVEALLAARERSKAPGMAPAKGLALVGVDYPDFSMPRQGAAREGARHGRQ